VSSGQKVVIAGLAAMFALVGGVLWTAHRTADPANAVMPPAVITAIEIATDVRLQGTMIKAGRYEVRLDRASETLMLVGAGGTHYLRAKRFVRPDVRAVSAELRALDGGEFVLLVRVPPGDEWAC